MSLGFRKSLGGADIGNSVRGKYAKALLATPLMGCIKIKSLIQKRGKSCHRQRN